MRNDEVLVRKCVAVDGDLAAAVALRDVAALEDEPGKDPVEPGTPEANPVVT